MVGSTAPVDDAPDGSTPDEADDVVATEVVPAGTSPLVVPGALSVASIGRAVGPHATRLSPVTSAEIRMRTRMPHALGGCAERP